MKRQNPLSSFFYLDDAEELVLHSGNTAVHTWNRTDRFYWVLTLSGNANFAESGRSQFLNEGCVLAKFGPLTGQIKLGDGRPWHIILLTASEEFATSRMAHVTRQSNKVHRVSLDSDCVKLARRLVDKSRRDPWDQSILAYEWFHAWWQEAELHNQEILRYLEFNPSKTTPAKHHFVSLKGLADQLGYSPGYLSRILRNKWKNSPAKSLHTARMQYAAEKLRATSIQVGALAYELGYLSESAFVRAFRRFHGQPPEKYRTATKSLA